MQTTEQEVFKGVLSLLSTLMMDDRKRVLAYVSAALEPIPDPERIPEADWVVYAKHFTDTTPATFVRKTSAAVDPADFKPRPAPTPEEYLSVPKAAKVAGITAANMYANVASDKVPHQKRKGKIVVPRSAVANYVKGKGGRKKA